MQELLRTHILEPDARTEHLLSDELPGSWVARGGILVSRLESKVGSEMGGTVTDMLRSGWEFEHTFSILIENKCRWRILRFCIFSEIGALENQNYEINIEIYKFENMKIQNCRFWLKQKLWAVSECS